MHRRQGVHHRAGPVQQRKRHRVAVLRRVGVPELGVGPRRAEAQHAGRVGRERVRFKTPRDHGAAAFADLGPQPPRPRVQAGGFSREGHAPVAHRGHDMHIFQTRRRRQGGEKEIACDPFVIDARLVRNDPVRGHEGIALGGQRARRDPQRQLLFTAGHEMTGQIQLAAGIPHLAARPAVHERLCVCLQHRERERQAAARPGIRHREPPLIPRLLHITDALALLQPRSEPHLLHAALGHPLAVRPHARHLEPPPAIARRRHGRDRFAGLHRPEAPQAAETDALARRGGLAPSVRERFGIWIGAGRQRRVRLDQRAQAADGQRQPAKLNGARRPEIAGRKRERHGAFRNRIDTLAHGPGRGAGHAEDIRPRADAFALGIVERHREPAGLPALLAQRDIRNLHLHREPEAPVLRLQRDAEPDARSGSGADQTASGLILLDPRLPAGRPAFRPTFGVETRQPVVRNQLRSELPRRIQRQQTARQPHPRPIHSHDPSPARRQTAA
ncbi:MAG: hypothetical protein BWX70_02692 [Verrucomicrobia bacterium ADurb.Bin070]|nr:MAG: hypothetical protein BWX70_02692 [Verrucomicrobia bacterium ADurb.Bin070]